MWTTHHRHSAHHVLLRPCSTGAHDRTRTGALFLTKEVLYQLSYMGTAQTAKNALLMRLRRPGGKQYFFRRIKGLSEGTSPAVDSCFQGTNEVEVERATRFELATLSLEG